MRSFLLGLVVAGGFLGCVSFPGARLEQGLATFTLVQGPAVCGPMGFRKVPLQARWGEYVRITVRAPTPLEGSLLVHAGGLALEPRAWTSGNDGVVAELRFPNESLERPFALDRDHPIDLTLTGLSAAAGGTCEGAVFTVEHGALVPSIDARAWVAELERRGGPELAARLAFVRAQAEARRQAHYALWAERKVELSVEARAEASVRREAHFALWEAQRAPPPDLEVATAGAPERCTAGTCSGPLSPGGADFVGVAAEGTCVSGTCAQRGSIVVAGSGQCTGGCAAGGADVLPWSATPGGCASSACAGSGASPASVAGVAATGAGGFAAGGTPTSFSGLTSSPAQGGAGCSLGARGGAAASCAAGSCGGSCSGAQVPGAVPDVEQRASPVVPTRAPASTGNGSPPACEPLPSVAFSAATSEAAEWNAYSVEAEAGWATLRRPEWDQPFAVRLEPVPVTTEVQVASAGAPPPRPAEASVELEVDAHAALVPAVLRLFLGVAAVAAQPPPRPVVRAVPIDPR